MPSLENRSNSDEKDIEGTLIDPKATGGEEDPDFVPTALDRLIEIGHPKHTDDHVAESTPDNVVPFKGKDTDEEQAPTETPDQTQEAA